MAGLLDFLNTPAGMGLLSAAAGGLAGARRGTPLNNIGRGAVSGLMGYSNAQDQIRQDEENAFAKQYKQMQMEQMQAAVEKQKAEQAWRAGLPDYLRPQTKYVVGDQQFGSQQEAQAAAMPNENTQLMAGAMGSQAAAQPVQEINAVRDPAELQAYLMQPGSPYADKIMEKQLFPAAADYKVVGDSLVQLGADGVKPVYTAPAKAPAMPSAVVEYQFARDQGYKGSFEEWKKSNARAGATNVTQSNFGEPKPYWNQNTQRYEFYQFDKRGNPRIAALPEGATPVDEGKLPEGQTKQIVGANNLQGAITEYVDQLKSWKKQDALNPNARAAMGVKYNNMMLQAKEAYNLGVLNGPDFEILTSVVTDPRSFTGAITSNKALESQANELSRIMNGIKKQAATKPRPTAQGQSQPANAISLDEYLKSQGH